MFETSANNSLPDFSGRLFISPLPLAEVAGPLRPSRRASTSSEATFVRLVRSGLIGAVITVGGVISAYDLGPRRAGSCHRAYEPNAAILALEPDALAIHLDAVNFHKKREAVWNDEAILEMDLGTGFAEISHGTGYGAELVVEGGMRPFENPRSLRASGNLTFTGRGGWIVVLFHSITPKCINKIPP